LSRSTRRSPARGLRAIKPCFPASLLIAIALNPPQLFFLAITVPAILVLFRGPSR
jgi:hypothetical protein